MLSSALATLSLPPSGIPTSSGTGDPSRMVSAVPPPLSAEIGVLGNHCPELRVSPPDTVLEPMYLLSLLLRVSFLGPASPLPFPPTIAPDNCHSAFWTPLKCSLFSENLLDHLELDI